MSATPIKSVTGRSFAVLNTFDGSHRRQSLAEMARRCELPVSTVHRLAAELSSLGALVRTAEGAYEIGNSMWRLGILSSLHSDLREIALPYMEDIYQFGNDAVQIGVLDGFSCLVIERIAGSRTLSVISKPGTRLPLHASGIGKVLLAHGDDDLREAVMGSLARFTGNTITNSTVLEKQLSEIRKFGFARSQEELAIGATSLAVPVKGRGKAVIAALGIVTPAENTDLNGLVAALKISAAALSTKLLSNGVGAFPKSV